MYMCILTIPSTPSLSLPLSTTPLPLPLSLSLLPLKIPSSYPLPPLSPSLYLPRWLGFKLFLFFLDSLYKRDRNNIKMLLKKLRRERERESIRERERETERDRVRDREKWEGERKGEREKQKGRNDTHTYMHSILHHNNHTQSPNEQPPNTQEILKSDKKTTCMCIKNTHSPIAPLSPSNHPFPPSSPLLQWGTTPVYNSLTGQCL